MIIPLGKNMLMLQRVLKAWLLMCLCYNHWMTLEDTTTLSYLSALIYSREAFKYLRKKLKTVSASQENQIWLKCRRWNWIRRFAETQSRIYAR